MLNCGVGISCEIFLPGVGIVYKKDAWYPFTTSKMSLVHYYVMVTSKITRENCNLSRRTNTFLREAKLASAVSLYIFRYGSTIKKMQWY